MEPTLYSERHSFDSIVLRWMAIEKECQVIHRVVETFEITMNILPCMQDHDLNLVSHEPIVHYLQERYPGVSLLPADPKIRAQIRQLCCLIREGIEDFEKEMDAMLIHGNLFLTGSEFTLVDIYAGTQLHLLAENGRFAQATTQYYYDRLTGRAAFKEAIG